MIVVTFAVLTCGVVSASRADAAAAIITENGSLKGISIFGVQGYLGIPYAVPPVGDLRWKPPVAHGKWPGVFQANQFGNFCTQPGQGSEDCLTLNVFTPNDKKKRE